MEVKGDGAKNLTRRIAAGQFTTPQVSAMVAGWFGSHGVGVRYRPGLADAFAPIGAMGTDVEKRLGWLRHAVVPTLQWLMTWYSEEELHAFLFNGTPLGKPHSKEDFP